MSPRGEISRSFLGPGTNVPFGLLVFWLILGFLVSLGSLYVLDFWSYKTLFQVTAENEFIEGDLDILNAKDSTHLGWFLQELVIHARHEDGSRRQLEVSRSTLVIAGPARFEARRIAQGNLVLTLREVENSRERFNVTIVPHGGDPIDLFPPVTVILADPASLVPGGQSISLPFHATDVAIGREPNIFARQEQPILRSGVLEVLGRTALQGRIYIARSSALRGGDVVTTTNKENTFKVVVRVDERPAMQIVAGVEADSMSISGFYTDPRFEELTLFNRLANDRILAGLGTLLGLIITLLGVIVVTRTAPDSAAESQIPSPASNSIPEPEEKAGPEPEPVPEPEPEPEPETEPGPGPTRKENEL